MLVTKQGTAKKVAAKSFADVRRSGIIAIKLSAGDELLAALPVAKGEEVILATAGGQSVRFKEGDIREMGRTAGGVRAMKLGKNDVLVGADAITKEAAATGSLLVMGQNGYGKKTKLKEYKTQKRGGSGIKTMKLTTKTGKLMASRVIDTQTEIVAISKNGQIIRTGLDEIGSLGRQTQGVRIMKLRDGDSIASLTCL